MTRTPPDPVDVLVGQLIARHGIRPSDAVTLLRRAAHRKGVSLVALATHIVQGRPHRVGTRPHATAP